MQEVTIKGKPTHEHWVPVLSSVLCQILGDTQSQVDKMADYVPRGRSFKAEFRPLTHCSQTTGPSFALSSVIDALLLRSFS